MTEIPEDIVIAARSVVYSIHSNRNDVEFVANAIAAAILAERKRCAEVAKDWPAAGLIKTDDENPQSLFAAGARAQGRTISKAIMKGATT